MSPTAQEIALWILGGAVTLLLTMVGFFLAAMYNKFSMVVDQVADHNVKMEALWKQYLDRQQYLERVHQDP